MQTTARQNQEPHLPTDAQTQTAHADGKRRLRGRESKPKGFLTTDPNTRFKRLTELAREVDKYFEWVDGKSKRGEWATISDKEGTEKIPESKPGKKIGAPYTHAGLATFLGVSLGTYNKMCHDPEYAKFHKYLAWVDTRMEAKLLDGALSGVYQGKAFDLLAKNRHGFAERLDITKKQFDYHVEYVRVDTVKQADKILEDLKRNPNANAAIVDQSGVRVKRRYNLKNKPKALPPAPSTPSSTPSIIDAEVVEEPADAVMRPDNRPADHDGKDDASCGNQPSHNRNAKSAAMIQSELDLVNQCLIKPITSATS